MADPIVGSWPVASPDLRIDDRPVPMSILRLRREDPPVIAALSAAFAIDWPIAPNTMTAGAASVCWLAPGVWAVLDLDPRTVAERTSNPCAAVLHHTADVSAGHLQFELHGGRARAVLAKGCSLDLHPREFPLGRCARTLLAQIPVLLFRVATQHDDGFHVIAEAGYARYLRTWFSDAAVEFGSAPA